MIRRIKGIYHFVFATSDTRVDFYIKMMCLCKERNLPRLGVILSRRLQRKYGVFLSYQAHFDESLILRHPTSIVIGDGVRIGNNVRIFQGVTLGRADTFKESYPVIGDNSIIYSGAVILGGVNIGHNCIVGANSVVINDVPDNHVVAGVPARIIKNKLYYN